MSRRMMSPEAVAWALAHHVGAANGVTARDLAVEVVGVQSASAERDLRGIIEQLRRDGSHVCGMPGEGYYMAADDAELLRTCEFLFARAMTSLVQVAAMRRVALPDLRGQLRLPYDIPMPAVTHAAGRPAGGAEKHPQRGRLSLRPPGRDHADSPTSRATSFPGDTHD